MSGTGRLFERQIFGIIYVPVGDLQDYGVSVGLAVLDPADDVYLVRFDAVRPYSLGWFA